MFDKAVSLNGVLNKAKFTSKWYGASDLPSEVPKGMIRAGEENPYFYLDENSKVTISATANSDERICYRMVAKKAGCIGRNEWKKGEVGGYVSLDTQLVPGKTWVGNKAKVAGCSLESGAIIKDNAIVTESNVKATIICGRSEIFKSNISGTVTEDHRVFPAKITGHPTIIGSTLVGSRIKDDVIIINSSVLYSTMEKKSAIACVDEFVNSEMTGSAILIGDKNMALSVNNARFADMAFVSGFTGLIDNNVHIDGDAFIYNSDGIMQNGVHFTGAMIECSNCNIRQSSGVGFESILYCTDWLSMTNSIIDDESVVCTQNGFTLVNTKFKDSHVAYTLDDNSMPPIALMNTEVEAFNKGKDWRNREIQRFATMVFDDETENMYIDRFSAEREVLPEITFVEELLHNEDEKIVEFGG